MNEQKIEYKFEQEQCLICMEPLGDRIRTILVCHHVFHERCLNIHIYAQNRSHIEHQSTNTGNTCPVCRTIIVSENSPEIDEVLNEEPTLRLVPELVLESHIIHNEHLQEEISDLKYEIEQIKKLVQCSFCGIRMKQSRLRNHVRKCLENLNLVMTYKKRQKS